MRVRNEKTTSYGVRYLRCFQVFFPPNFIPRSWFGFLLICRDWLDKCVLNEGVSEVGKKTKQILKL